MAATPTAPVTAELSDILALATSLFAQCKGRDAPSSFKLLAPSLRKLRDGLEDIEEDYDPTRTLGPDDVRLLNQIGRSHDILSRLELALQAHSSSGLEDVNMNAVSDLKTALDVCAHQLKTAFEATTTGEIPLKLDTRDFPNHAHVSASIEDSSASRSRKSSMWSLANKSGPQSPGASDGTSVHTDRIDRSHAEEKQLLSPSMSISSDTRASMDWRSPFSDPLSMGIEAATSLILSSDDDLSMSAYARPRSRSRAESNVSAATETFVSAPASPELERKPAARDARESTASIAETQPVAKERPSIAVGVPASYFPSEDVGEPAGTQTSAAVPVAVGEEHLGHETATRDLGLERQRADSDASVEEGAPIDPQSTPSSVLEAGAIQDDSTHAMDMPRSNNSGEDATEHETIPTVQPSVPASVQLVLGNWMAAPGAPEAANDDAQDFTKDFSRVMNDALKLSNEQHIATFKPLPPSPAFDSVSTVSADDPEQPGQASPPPPSRRPPPPPPPPATKRSRPNVKLSTAKSKYRIVNDASGDSSSDEELYSSSRPGSPAKAAGPVSVQSPPLATPTIHIDQSALDHADRDVEAGGPAELSDQEHARDVSDDAPQLPQTVYTSPRFTKSEPLAASSGPASASSHRRENTDDRTPTISQAPPVPAPRSSKSTPQLKSPESPRSPPLPRSVQKRIAAAVYAGDRLLAGEIETEFWRERVPVNKSKSESEEKPPPIPPRPKARPRAASAIPSPVVLVEKELALGTGLGSEPSAAARPHSSSLVSRVSVDHALNIDTVTAPEVLGASDGARHARSASTSQLPRPQFSLRNSQSSDPPASADGRRLTGWYGPGADQTSRSELDNERIEHICHFFNNMRWDQAEQYLMGYLESLIEQNDLAVARRVRHLLAVCASFKGDFSSAITTFLSVVEITEPADLHRPGNCEALYHLGDLYAMQNQRLEALLAYSAAQWGELFQDPTEPNMSDLVKAEQEAVQLGMPKSEYQLRWSQAMAENTGTIVDPNILPPHVVKYLFEMEPRRYGRSARPFQLDPNKPRSSAFFSLSASPQIGKFRRNKISTEHFHPAGPWPLQYDPTFAMANVKRERLLSAECDLLSVLQAKDAESKLPKLGPMSISRMDTFTSSDLPWLIAAVRDCLRMLEMSWSEVGNDQGAWFIVRHTLMDGPAKNPPMKIATVHYFAIALFRSSFRASFGVEVCSHGVSSARIMDPSNLDYERGAHYNEAKRIKRLVIETLEEAEKRRPKARKRQSAMGLGLSRSSSDDQPVKLSSEGPRPPPIPPRPKKSSGSS